MRYICERCGKEIDKTRGGGMFVKKMGEEVLYSVRLCADCTHECIDNIKGIADQCSKFHQVEKPHKITNKEVLLKEATRQDVRDFLEEYGIDEKTAFEISERIRKGHASSRGLPEDMMNTLKNASVPEWFIEGCRTIIYLSDRNNYSAPSLVGDEESEEPGCEIFQNISFEITEWKAPPTNSD